MFDEVADVLAQGLPLHFLGEFVPQLFQVDPAQVVELGFLESFDRGLRADRFVDDAVQCLEQFRHVGRVAPFAQFLVDGFEVVVPLGVDERGRLHQQGLEADEHLPGQNLEAAFGFVGGVNRFHRVSQGGNP
ncbi:MAG: hypothetical protein U1F70_01910 [Candidatus Competibacteraceae bacterium]